MTDVEKFILANQTMMMSALKLIIMDIGKDPVSYNREMIDNLNKAIDQTFDFVENNAK